MLRLDAFLTLTTVAASALLLGAGCSRSSSPRARAEAQSAEPAAEGVAASPARAPSGAKGVRSAYPIGERCARPEAVAEERRTLAHRDAWKVVASGAQRVAARVPEGVFAIEDGAAALVLKSDVKAAGLGPDGAGTRAFAVRIQRVAKGVDEVLSDGSKGAPLGGVFLSDAFPERTTASFVPRAEEPVVSGAAYRATLAGRPAWVWVTGAHGYNTDAALIEIGPKDTVVVRAEWNSSVMAGQPECWQRAVLGGVIESLERR